MGLRWVRFLAFFFFWKQAPKHWIRLIFFKGSFKRVRSATCTAFSICTLQWRWATQLEHYWSVEMVGNERCCWLVQPFSCTYLLFIWGCTVPTAKKGKYVFGLLFCSMKFTWNFVKDLPPTIRKVTKEYKNIHFSHSKPDIRRGHHRNKQQQQKRILLFLE